MNLFLFVAALLVLAALAHRVGARPVAEHDRITRALESRGILAVVFATTFIALWCSWAALMPPPVVHDEMSYVLQSQIFASGRWALPPQPIPAFWEQPHVLVEPVVASKYFPGHSIVLTIGTLLGWPALMPLVLQSVAGVLLYLLVRRVANPALAFVTWVVWLTTPMVLHFGATYFSESTTTVCWLGGWYALLEWRTSRQRKWLLAVAFFTAWCFLTRPLTGLAYVIPIGVVVLRDVIRGRHWRDLGMGLAAGAAVLAILPLWSAMTTGDWSTTPLLLYTRQYMPYDVPGFGVITTPPALEVSQQLANLNDAYRKWHVNHFPSTMLSTLVYRVRPLAESIWGLSRGAMIAFALLGLLALNAKTAFAVGSSVLLLLVYLVFATPSQWTLYYYESVPAYAFLTALGLAWAASMIGRPRGTAPAPAFTWRSARWTMPLVASTLVLAVPGLIAIQKLRREHVKIRADQTRFAEMRESIPDRKAVLFVHYKPAHNPNISFVQNVVDPAAERVWVVFDRGPAENARLMAQDPERVAYIYDENQDATFRYDPQRVK